MDQNPTHYASLPRFTADALEVMKFTLERKQADYSAISEDPYINFKQTGEITGQSAVQVALTLCGIKLSRLGQLSGPTTPVNESVRDSLLDLANYATLALAMHMEAEND